MLSLIYNLLFMPIELIVEVTYSFMHNLLNNTGVAIIAVSIVIQTLVLPLYKRADAMQDEERQRQKNMEYWVNHIKHTFKGDEKYMMLSTYYREQNYKSWYAIKSSASILLQIPFFTAAYHFLSNLTELSGESFLFIKDLSKPDATFAIGSMPVNILPILMTTINIISGIIYTRNLKFREKAQVYGLAVVFLVLLYNSPSGLVLYWTMNNTYSLLKNIVEKIIKKRIHLFSSKSVGTRRDVGIAYDNKQTYRLYISSAIFLTAFVGGVILLNVVNSSATEFINYNHGPLYLVVSNLATFTGFFLLWGSVFYVFMTDKLRSAFSNAAVALVMISVIDAIFFGNKMGTMSPLFEYDGGLAFSAKSKIINLILVIIGILVVSIVVKKKPLIVQRVVQIMAISAICMCIVLMFGIEKQVKEYEKNLEVSSVNADEKIYSVSQEGKNVIVIMMDRAISGFIPYIFEEKPEIADYYKGFTYFPNTISFGVHTNFGTPGLFGGYEYTPEAINKRPDETLKEKHNEAMLVMPALFSEAGFNVTVTDPPYAGSYEKINDLSIYNKYENVKAYNTKGAYMGDFEKLYAPSYQAKQESVAFYYSVMKMLPTALQGKLYNGGKYCSKKEIAVNRSFLESYSALLSLANITEVQSGTNNNFLLIQNSATHDVSALDVPDYIPVEGARNNLDQYKEYYGNLFGNNSIKLSNITQIAHYQSNVACLRELGKWFEYLKSNECWDNTRVVIVADHGFSLGNFENMQFDNGLDIEAYNPLLLYKDFGTDSYAISDEFMTIADTPYMAMNGIIDNPINPFTGNAISNDEKEDGEKVTTSHNYSPQKNNGNTFDTSDGEWYEVTPGNIFDEANWKKVDE